jgi:hypothetical protein
MAFSPLSAPILSLPREKKCRSPNPNRLNLIAEQGMTLQLEIHQLARRYESLWAWNCQRQ